ncbi:MAG: hypothetical protein P0119_00380 [Nitrospira sp.]|nr:hypothetical protein [Nitrospira sp.]
MAKKQGDSKLAVAGTITLGLAIAGVLLVQQPLKSTRPPSLGGQPAPHPAEGLVQARLWEDPLEAVRRVAIGEGILTAAGGEVKDDVERVRVLRQELDDRIALVEGRPITVLLVATDGGSSGESRESRIRDRYAIGSALGVACYAPRQEDQLSYIVWRDQSGASRVLPYEWYEEGLRTCSLEPTWAQAVLVLWISSEIAGDRPIAALRRLTESILCTESSIGRHVCRRSEDGTVLLDLQREQHVRFKIVGPRSSSAFRNLLEEAAASVQGREAHVIWANYGGRIELYSPWATAMPKLLTQGITVRPKPPESTECASPDASRASRAELCWILLRVGIELKHSIGSDDHLFEAMIQELERRRVKFERDAIVLIGEWDSFYGRVLPVEFTAAVCSRIAHRSDEDNRAIEADRLARIQADCATYDQAVDLQVRNPSGTRELELNIRRYSYLRGLDGELPGGDKGEGARVSATKQVKGTLFGNEILERPVGTSQFDYAQRLAARIERDMTEEANLRKYLKAEGEGGDKEAGLKPVAAIGILGSDAYDALLVLQAMRERFPDAVFFTTDLDSRLVYAEDYHWTRNLVLASHYGLELYGLLQGDVPPFRSSYQTSAYFAILQAVGHVWPLRTCPPEAASRPVADTPLSPCGYKANLTADRVWFSAEEPPRLFEVGRHGAIDLSVGTIEQGYTLHPPRVDLSNHDPQTNGRRPPSGALYGTAGLAYLIGFVICWTRPDSHQWVTRHTRELALGALGAFALAFVVDKVLLDLLLRDHDQGEPFYWFEGVSLWPTEILRGLGTLLALVLLVKGWWNLRSNLEHMTERYGFALEANKAQPERWRRYLTTVQWGLSPRGLQSDMQAGPLWQLYREAGSGLNRLMRLLILMTVYAMLFMLLWKVMGTEDFSGPCRGLFSCHLDVVLALASFVCLAGLNLFVFDAVLLCRRWIGALDQVTEGWPAALTDHLEWQRPENMVKAQELMKIDLISQRTDVVNRLVRYPFIVLLVVMVARNSYFDDWHFPLTMMVGWVVNVLLAMAAALLLYRAAEQARHAILRRLNHAVLKGLDRGAASDGDVKLTRQVIEDIEAVGQGAFVPLWQQPVVESSFYGLVAFLQYLYLS